MTEQEAQQAQTIAEIKERYFQCPLARQMDLEDVAFAKIDREKLLEIVDSQAQKIAEQAKRIEILEKCYYAAMNRFAFDSEENRGAWYEAQNNKRDSEGFTVET